MPSYELVTLIRQMSKPEIASALKRISVSIFNNQGIIRSIENMGTRTMPYKISAHKTPHRVASYFLIKFDSDTQKIATLNEEYGRDIDIIRRSFTKVEPENEIKCTLTEELQPPAYRKEVQEMIKMGKRSRDRYKLKLTYKSGLTYYPFQR